MTTTFLAHATTADGGAGASVIDGIASFGALWLVPLAVAVPAVIGALVLLRVGRAKGMLFRLGDGAARATGLPDWVALPVITMLGVAMPFAALGFYWDVAWHIDLGRDEVLFSPPHVALITGLVMIGVAGALAIPLATRAKAPHAWRLKGCHVPIGAAAFLVAGTISMLAFAADEAWHAIYGLDVSMWGPTHLTMVSAAAFSPLAVFVLLGEAGVGAGHRAVVRGMRWMAAAVSLVALSAWQLEFDLGVSPWQHLYHPVLIAFAGALGLTVARYALGRGGAIVATLGYVGVRGAFSLSVAGLGLTTPRFPLYLAAALIVEAAAGLSGSTLKRGVVTGLAVGTVGLAAAWGWTHVWGYRPWQVAMLPRLWVAVVVAVAAAVLGIGAGRIASFRPSGLRTSTVAACFAALALGVAIPFPRHLPDASMTVRTAPAGPGLVDVAVALDDPAVVQGAEVFEVFSWQGGGSNRERLVRSDDGWFRTEDPVPVGGTWKTMIAFALRDQRAAVPIFLPRDDAIGASEVPVVAEKRAVFENEAAVLQREAHDGPTWPAIAAYTWVLLSILALVATVVAGFVGLDRRRRAGVLGRVEHAPSLEGRRIVVTGAAGGIGEALVDALEANGGAVVGIDRVERDGVLACDLTDAASTERAMHEAERRLGGIDVLVNNAGVGTAGDAAAFPNDAERDTVEVNLFGTWNATAAAMPALIASGGHVVIVSSGLAVATVPYAAAYAASKRGVEAYADVLRMEHGRDIAVSAVRPGYVRTSIHAGPAAAGASLEGLVRADTVEDAAGAVVAVIESRRRRMASSPTTAVELAAARVAPRAVERAVARRLRRIERTRPKPSFLRFRDRGVDAGTIDERERQTTSG